MRSSFIYDVTRTGGKSGAAAVKTLRSPLSFDTQAMRSAFLAATSSIGNAALMNCAIVGVCSVGLVGVRTSARAWPANARTARATSSVRFMPRDYPIHMTEYSSMSRIFVLGLAVAVACATLGAQTPSVLTADVLKRVPLRSIGPDITTCRISDGHIEPNNPNV